MASALFKNEKRNKSELAVLRVELVTVFVFMNCMGFPGTYCQVFGNILEVLVGYGAFFLEIGMMLLLSGKDFMDIRVIDLKEKFSPVYQYIVIVFAMSMIVTSSPSDQVITCLRLSVTILFALWLSERMELERIIELFCYAQVMVDLSIVGIILLRPGLAFQNGDTFYHALRGIYTAKNALASELAFGFTVLFLNIVNLKDRRARWILFAMVHMVLLLMAKATGALLICASLVCFYLFVGSKAKWRVNLGWWYIVISVGFLFFAFTILPLFDPVFKMLGKDSTLTGRTTLWNGIYAFIQEHNMLTGFGYGHFWLDARAVARLHSFFDSTSFFGRMTSGAHNQIMELWLNTGLIGLGSYFAVILLSLRRSRTMNIKLYQKVSCLLLYVTICGLTERVFENAYAYRVMLFFILMGVSCSDDEVQAAERRKAVLNEYR